MKAVLWILSILCLGYYFVIIGYAGIKATFSKVWLAAGISFLVLALLKGWGDRKGFGLLDVIPSGIKLAAGCLLVAGMVLFLAVEGCIASGMNSSVISDLDYIIVLGAKVKGEVPSKALYKRLLTAEKYLKDNPDTIGILSGGKGPGENITEAEAMKRFLVNRGIGEERLRLEPESTDTVENLKMSRLYIQEDSPKVGVVTNNFHVYRGVAVGKKMGYKNITGIPASSDPVLQVNYLVREFFAVVKDKIAGNI